MDKVKLPSKKKRRKYCSVFNCPTRCPNDCDVYLHRVKPEWLNDPNIYWKTSQPRSVCDLHFSQDSYISEFVAGRKRNRLKPGSKPLINVEREERMKSNSGGETFKCSSCARSFLSKVDLIRHTGKNAYQCTVCQELFTRKGDLYDHMKSHNSSSPYQCTVCGESYTSKYDLYDHMKSYHYIDLFKKSSQQAESTAKISKETIKTEVKEDSLDDDEFDENLHYAFSSDINVKEEPMIKTEIKEEPLDEDDMKEKIVDEKGNVIGYQTKGTEGRSLQQQVSIPGIFDGFECNETIDTKVKENYLGEDERDVSQEETGGRFNRFGEKIKKRLTHCPICGKFFNKESYERIQKHIDTHSKHKTFSCDICFKTFTTSLSLKKKRGGVVHTRYPELSLKNHIKNNHTGKRKEKKNSKQQESISETLDEPRETINTEVKEKVQQVNVNTNEKNSDKGNSGESLTCDQCGKNFKDIAMLNVHKWIH